MDENQLSSFIAERKKEGFSDDEIRAVLARSAGAPNQLPVSTPTAPVTAAQEEEKHMSPSQVLMTLGIALVLVSTTVVVFNSWEELSNLSRWLIIAVPNAVLMLISFFIKEGTVQHAKDGTQAAAMVMLPATVGTFLYQFQIYPQVDALLMFWSALSALPLFLYYDFLKRKDYAVKFSPLIFLASVIFLGTHLKWETLTWVLIGSVLGAAFLMLAKFFHQNNAARTESYKSYGAILLIFSAPVLLRELLGYNSMAYYSQSFQLMDIFYDGILLIVIGSLFGWLFKPNDRTDKTIQAISYLLAMLVIFGGLITRSSSDVYYLAVTVVTSAVFIVLGMMLGASLFYTSGIIGLVLSLVFYFLNEVALAQVITLFVLGFIAIGLGVLLGKIKSLKHVMYSERLAAAFGIVQFEEPAATVGDSTRKHLPKWINVSLVILALWLIGRLALILLFSGGF